MYEVQTPEYYVDEMGDGVYVDKGKVYMEEKEKVEGINTATFWRRFERG